MQTSQLNWTVELATRIADWDRNNDPSFNIISAFDIKSYDLQFAKDQALEHAQHHPITRCESLWETDWINIENRCVRIFVYLTLESHYWFRINLIPHGFRVTQVMRYDERLGI